MHVRGEKEGGGERGVRKNWREKEQNVDYGGMVQPVSNKLHHVQNS